MIDCLIKVKINSTVENMGAILLVVFMATTCWRKGRKLYITNLEFAFDISIESFVSQRTSIEPSRG